MKQVVLAISLAWLVCLLSRLLRLLGFQRQEGAQTRSGSEMRDRRLKSSGTSTGDGLHGSSQRPRTIRGYESLWDLDIEVLSVLHHRQRPALGVGSSTGLKGYCFPRPAVVCIWAANM